MRFLYIVVLASCSACSSLEVDELTGCTAFYRSENSGEVSVFRSLVQVRCAELDVGALDAAVSVNDVSAPLTYNVDINESFDTSDPRAEAFVDNVQTLSHEVVIEDASARIVFALSDDDFSENNFGEQEGRLIVEREFALCESSAFADEREANEIAACETKAP